MTAERSKEQPQQIGHANGLRLVGDALLLKFPFLPPSKFGDPAPIS